MVGPIHNGRTTHHVHAHPQHAPVSGIVIGVVATLVLSGTAMAVTATS